MPTTVKEFHLGPAADAATMTEQNVRRVLAMLSRKTQEDEQINAAIQQVIDNPAQVHTVGVFMLQYRA
ncbi:hypothetical protein HX891_10955 [Pseudomonas reactans]|uniref:hypothetical protein n=1 Tax=Pseudomonas reactans TaxID=117680 RepID=UPI0015C1C5FE|nr:hypothetical protein [Pseudomonas reactans]NWD80897.1 hypothetical protein [Pseudomonas reactans]